MNLKLTVVLSLLLVSGIYSYGQDINYWNTLKDVEIKTRPDETGRYEIEYPQFGEKLKSLEGKTIRLKGYMVPLKEYTGHKFFVLSAYPFNMCFFCGMAGPETVIEIYSVENISYTSDKIEMEGTLKLNYDDANHLMYILNDAKLID